ncbi:quinolinate synthase NadA [Haloimpatiens sp. FM7315]|uniref:quinolinate synthase NadA n=1 Tax=Haloimpatiens sp. FM7315 TaxID=3298609 RepID=UPI0035A33283
MAVKLKEEILRLKKERNAIILAHYYENDEVKDVADEVGDSFYLSKIAKNCSENTILFCGVKFMGESAKILSPNKKVLMPLETSLCPMADMIKASDIENLKKQHPKAKVVCYINSSALVKAVSEVCCTSSNAVKVVSKLDAEEVIFVPDKNLGSYVKERVKDKNIILWDGYCYVHNNLKAEKLLCLKNQFKDAKVLAHPECNKEIRDLADFIGSTGGMLKFAKETNYHKYIVVTEVGIIYDLKKACPNKEFISLDCMVCRDMKKTTLEDVYKALKEMKYEVNLNDDIIKRANNSLENMLLLGR